MSDNTIEFEDGDTIEILGDYTDEAGAPINLTGCTLFVFKSSPPELKVHGVCTITDAAAGKWRFSLPDQCRDALRYGALSTLRLVFQLPSGKFDALPLLRISIG